MFNSLRSLLRTGQDSAKRPPQKRRFVPRLEFLENRLAPSVSVVTDRADYLPGSTALINASGFDAGTAVQFQVVKTNVTPNVVESTWSVTDGSAADLDQTVNGSAQTSWYVPPDPSISLDATFTVTATGLSGGVSATASTTFTDGNPNLNSFIDGTPMGIINGNPVGGPYTNPGTWANGNLNGNKAQYFEGMSVPFESVFSTTPNTTYTLTITYSTTKATAHAFDYLTSYDFNNTSPFNSAGLNWTTFADPLAPSSGTGLPDGTAPSFQVPIPSDPNINPNPPIADQNMLPGHSQTLGQFITLYGTTNLAADNFVIGANTASHGYTLSAPYASGDSDTSITIQFKPAGSNVVVAWGAHIGFDGDWGTPPGGAFSIPGSPYHVSISATGAGTSPGSQDHQMQASVVAQPAQIIVNKVSLGGTGTFTFNGTGGTIPVSFPITTTGPGTPGSTNKGATATLTVPAGTYGVTENIPAGWELESSTISGTGVSGTTDSFTLVPGGSASLTFTDEKLATIIVNKTSIGGVGPFNFTASTTGTDPGTEFGTTNAFTGPFSITTLTAGVAVGQTFTLIDPDSTLTYGVAETVPNGWILTASSVSGDVTGGSGGGTPNISFKVLSGGTATVSYTDTMGTSSTSTVIKDSGGGAVTSTLGEAVFDTATVTVSPNTFTATGTVTYTFTGTNGTSIAGLTPPASWSGGGTNTWTEIVTLVGGNVPNSDLTPALPAGSYQFQASYSGDSHYAGSTSLVEPMTISKANSTAATTIKDATTNSTPTGALGETVYDTTTVTASPFTPTGTVTYTFTGTNGTSIAGLTPPVSWSGGGTNTWTEIVTLVGGTVPHSDLTAALPAGSYRFQAS